DSASTETSMREEAASIVNLVSVRALGGRNKERKHRSENRATELELAIPVTELLGCVSLPFSETKERATPLRPGWAHERIAEVNNPRKTFRAQKSTRSKTQSETYRALPRRTCLDRKISRRELRDQR